MRLLLIAALLGLTGCTTLAPVHQPMPELPDALRYSCKNLIPLHEEARLSDLMRTVNTNYARHHECAAQVDAFIDWYEKQKKIND